MKNFLQQTPAFLASIAWVFVLNLLQPLFAQCGIFVYADAVFLFIPALFMSTRAAFATVVLCTLFADATRPSPFGLSATLLLPALPILIAVKRELRRWPRLTWTGIALLVNTLACLALAGIFSQTAAAPPPEAALAATIAGTTASALLIAVFANWFWEFQLSLSAAAGRDLLARAQKNEE